MSGIKDSERMDALRQRLYERDTPVKTRTEHQLSDETVAVPRSWGTDRAETDTSNRPRTAMPVDGSPMMQQPAAKKPAPSPAQTSAPTPTPARTESPYTSSTTPMGSTRKRKGYRLKMVAIGVIFFIVAILSSITIMTFGNRGISGENIALSVSGPFTIGGGETMPIQVGLTNNNTVSIESATLVVEYPRGTLAANDERKELFSERLPLDSIAAGETINVPLRAIVFGEENEEEEIKVSVEYRIANSNALFFKEADALRFKISSSPVVLTVDALKKVSAGQETDVTVTVTSNAQNTLSDVLVTAEYPIGFSYTTADPLPTSGQNQWHIDSLEPGQSTTFKIKGMIVGNTSDEYAINFAIGVPNERDGHTLAAVFSTAQINFEVEDPFLGIVLEVAGVTGGTAVVKPEERSSVSVEITNSLKDTIYDVVAEVQLSGNAISDLEVGPPSGFYDSANRKIVWDISSSPDLEKLEPGQTARLTFAIAPSGDVSKAPEINIKVNVQANRISESNVTEVLTGTAAGTMKVASEPVLDGFATHNSGVFSDTGAIPPVAEEKTSYSISWAVQNGTNDISGTTVTATLPSYVTWEDKTSGSGTFTYNEAKRLVTWTVGKVDAQSSVFGSFQVSIVPSKSQVGTAPTLVGEQYMRADDLFTGTVVRDDHAVITTEMSTEVGYNKGNGKVVE